MNNKVEEARIILSALQVPASQQSDLCCNALIALADIKMNDSWQSASNKWIRIHDIIAFLRQNYGVYYAENSRETFRKQAMHHFRNAAFIEDNGKATNSPNYRYRLTEEMVRLLASFDTDLWDKQLYDFLANHETLKSQYDTKRSFTKIPVKINEKQFTFSTGSHNRLQKAIIEEFAPRFAANAECLYVGDTTEKDLVKEEKQLKELGFLITLHDKMPDVVLYVPDRNWLFFVEAVTSVGPMSPKRIIEIDAMTKDVKAEKIFVTAFLDFKTFKKFSDKLAWETEVWIAEMPDHMIHFNGDKFLGSRK